MVYIFLLAGGRALLHVVTLLAIFFGVYGLRLSSGRLSTFWIGTGVDVREIFQYGSVSIFFFLLFGFTYGLYRFGTITSHQTQAFLRVWSAWIVMSTFVAFFGQGWIRNGISRFVIVMVGVVSLVVLPLVDVLYNRYIPLLMRRFFLNHPRRILIVHETREHADRLQRMTDRGEGSIIEYLDTHGWQKPQISPTEIVFVGTIAADVLTKIVDSMRGSDCLMYHVPDESLLPDINSRQVMYHGIPAWRYQMTTIEGRMRLIKRGVDVCGSLLGLIILSPLLALVALLIKVDSSGPVLYRQTRVGKGGKHFQFLKFRSMYRDDCTGDAYGGDTARAKRQQLINSPANVRPGILQKIANDPRVTRVGRFIRAVSIDELPSLRCVLVGDMSLVGPRPHMPHEVAQYEDRHKKLFTVKPGITGYAQIHGRDQQDFTQEAQYDITYIHQWSLLLDRYVMMRTVTVLFVGKGK